MLNGLVPFLFGLIMIILRKKMYELWKKQQYFLTKREYPSWSFEIPYLIGGIIFIIIGAIELLKHIK